MKNRNSSRSSSYPVRCRLRAVRRRERPELSWLWEAVGILVVLLLAALFMN